MTATGATAIPAGRFFFPLDDKLDLRGEDFSPSLLEKLEWLGGQEDSFEKGSQTAGKLLGLEITAKGLRNLTEKLGEERAERRDAEVLQFEKGDLSPRRPEPPQVAVVFLDGGRARVRASDAPPGVHEPDWNETKVANVSTYSNLNFQEDPKPEPPEKFLDPPQVVRLIEELKGASGNAKAKKQKTAGQNKEESRDKKERMPEPKKLLRTVVATKKDSDEFGRMVVTEAAQRGFFQAVKRAVVADGGIWIWAIAALHFVGFVFILDFVHLLSHLYAGAQAAHQGDLKKAWELYAKLLRLSWGGDVLEVLKILRKHAERLGEPPKGVREDDPRKVLWGTLGYVEKNKDKMEYPRYRREGLPISSAPVESLIRQVNIRVKGTQKFWVREGLEAVLQVNAACLSEDGRLEEFWRCRRRGRAVGQNRLKPAA